MEINEIFEKNINRDIIVNVQVSDSSKDYLIKLINEFSFTKSVLKNLSEFFSFYNSQLKSPKSNAVLISGKIGTGKSFFLKILSLLLNDNIEINNESSLNYIKTEKLNDNLLNNIRKNQYTSKDSILFNFDSKITYYGNKSILNCLFNEFNKIRGFCDYYPFVAYFEKQLCLKNMFDDFKLEFKRVYGEEWEDIRNDFFFIFTELIESTINIGFLDENEAEEWFNNLYECYEFSVDEFCEEINKYCEIKGNNHHIIFFIDELMASILYDKDLLIEFQDLMNQLSKNCMGKVFVIATSQLTIEDINSNLSELNIHNFTKIFQNELFFNLENIIDVIKLNLLSKKSDVKFQLTENLNNNLELFNSTYFDDFNIQVNEFVECYPFLNYQFNLFIEIFLSYYKKKTFKSFITWGAGHYSLVMYCQDVLCKISECEYGSLISFNLFFNELYLDHEYRKIFFNENKNISQFDLKILKVIFMLNFSDEIHITSKNITTLMISNVKEDPFELNKKIDKSLEWLVKEDLIEKNENSYKFHTGLFNEELI